MPKETTIKLCKDGDKWCALEGENLQVGIAGFGDSPYGALVNFLREKDMIGMVGYQDFIAHCQYSNCPGIFNDIREDGFYCNDCGISLYELLPKTNKKEE